MLRVLLILVGLNVLTISPIYPDIVDFVVNGSVSGSGNVSVACAQSTPGCVSIGGGRFRLFSTYDFSAADTSLGTVSAVGSATSPLFPASILGSASETATATSNTLGLTLMGETLVFGDLPFSWNASATISVGFVLTEASILQLSGGAFASPSPPLDIGALLDEHGNVILTLPNPSSVSATLGPGMYQLESSIDSSGFGHLADLLATTFELDLGATFTPVATPEPRGASVIVLAIALGSCALAGRRRWRRA